MAKADAGAKEVEKTSQEEPLIVLINDLGFSSMKWYAPHLNSMGKFLSAYKQTGDKLKIGEAAMIDPNASYLRGLDDLLYAYPFMCKESIRAAKLNDIAHEKLHMVLGMPYEYWVDETEKPGQGKIGLLTNTMYEVGGYGKVTIFPQGLGGILAWTKSTGKTSGNILGVDIGFNTLIVTLYNPSIQDIIYGKMWTKKGIQQMAMDHLAPKIKHLFSSRTPTPISLCQMMELGHVPYGGEIYEIGPEMGQAAEEYSDLILREIKSELQANVGEGVTFDTMLFFGGGANFLGNKIPSGKNVKAIVPPNPEFMNAIGFAIAAGAI